MKHFILLALSALVPALAARAGDGDLPSVLEDPRAGAVAVLDRGGELAVAAATWSAAVDDRGLRFGTPGGAELALEPRAVLRRGWREDLRPGALTRDERSLARPVSAAATERMDLRPDGVELSYVFPARPPGRGDLVVRLAVRTALSAPQGTFGDAGLAFAGPGGAVRVGAVTGVAADGATAPGALRWDGAHLDLVLPAAFVDSAAYPLVLDPLVGSVSTVDSSSFDSDADLAYDPTSGRWAFVWNRVYWNGALHLALMRRATSSGQPFGSLIVLGAAARNTRPVVTDCHGPAHFVFAYLGGTASGGPRETVVGTVNAHTGAYDPAGDLRLASTTPLESVDIGGHTTHALVVTGTQSGRVSSRDVSLHSFSGRIASASLETVLHHPTSVSGQGRRPRVSANGQNGRWYVAWTIEGNAGAGGRTVLAHTAVLAGHGYAYPPDFARFDSTVSYRDVACAGDGDETFVLSYVRDHPTQPDEVHVDRYVLAFSGGSTFARTGTSLVHRTSGFGSASSTAVETTGPGPVVAWRESSWGSSIRAASLDAATLAPCEPAATVQSGFLAGPRLHAPNSSLPGTGPGLARLAWWGNAGGALGAGVFSAAWSACP